MKIEFKKVLSKENNFNTSFNDVNLKGTFLRTKDNLVKVKGNLQGKVKTICSKCGSEIEIDICENVEYSISDGLYNSDNEENNLLIIEAENGIIDFTILIESEVNCIKSDYYYCKNCTNNEVAFEKEF